MRFLKYFIEIYHENHFNISRQALLKIMTDNESILISRSIRVNLSLLNQSFNESFQEKNASVIYS